MEQASRDAFTPAFKVEVFKHLGLVETEWQDLGGFESFVFAHQGRRQILRITHQSHRSAADIQAEVEFLTYLYDHNAPVCAPLKLQEKWIIQHGEFICCLFAMAEGREIDESDWSGTLFNRWGSAIGMFHRLSSVYQPAGAQRFDWQQDGNLHFRRMIPGEQAQLLEYGDHYLDRLRDLDVTNKNFGLIHSDAHAGNFFWQGDQLQVFDFDDCCYQWFTFDIATIVFSAVLQPWMPDGQEQREAIATEFLPAFLKGYNSEFEVEPFLLEQLPLFLKLREFSLYGVIHSHMDVNNLQDWYPIKFMAGRKERLEQDLPYLDIDFSALAGSVK